MLSLMDLTRTHTELRIQVTFNQSLGMYIVITIFFTPNTPGADKEFMKEIRILKERGLAQRSLKKYFQY